MHVVNFKIIKAMWQILKWPQSPPSLMCWSLCNVTVQLPLSEAASLPLPLNLALATTCFGQWIIGRCEASRSLKSIYAMVPALLCCY